MRAPITGTKSGWRASDHAITSWPVGDDPAVRFVRGVVIQIAKKLSSVKRRAKR